MNSQWMSILNPLISFAVSISIQIMTFRFLSRLSLLRSVFLGFFVGQVFVFAIEQFVHSNYFESALMEFLWYYLANVIIFSFLWHGSFAFIGLGGSARRSRILKELDEVPEGLSMTEILEKYNAKDMVNFRMSRLLNSGQVVLKDERYFTGKPTILHIARLVLFMKQMILRKKSEFD